MFNSHPLSEDRRERLARADKPATGEPLLATRDWMALKTICRS